LDGDALLERAHGDLLSALRGLVLGVLRDAHPLAVVALPRDQLVDHARRRRARAGDDARADTVRIHGARLQARDGVLVQVAGDGDAGAGGAERVEQRPGLAGDLRQVARIESDAAQAGARDLDGGADALL